MRKMITCNTCGKVKPHKAKGMCQSCYSKEYRENHKEQKKEHYEKNKKDINENKRIHYYESGKRSMEKNKSCTLFLGVHIAEQVLSKVFKDVKQMPVQNPGYDFVCSKNMKIDVKSSTLHKDKRRPTTQGYWEFNINKNKIPDYFLCLAFDDRKNLTPLHIWLIPGEVLNNLTKASIAIPKLLKWKKYEKNINKVILCCDSMRK